MQAILLKTLAAALAAASSIACQAGYQPGMLNTAQSFGGARDRRVPVEMPVAGSVDGLRSYGVPFLIPGSETWISSFLITKKRNLFRDSDPFDKGGLAARGESQQNYGLGMQLRSIDVRWHNALLVDRGNGEQWPLLEQRAFISRWWLVVDVSAEKPAVQAMIFSVTSQDTNGDGVLNNFDSSVAVMTDGDGRNPQAVTPAHTQLSAVHLFGDQGLVGFELRNDDNQDQDFESDESLRVVYLSLSDEQRTLRSWHDPQAESALEALYR